MILDPTLETAPPVALASSAALSLGSSYLTTTIPGCPEDPFLIPPG